MEYNLVTHLESCTLFIQEYSSLIYYSHLPTAIVALFVGGFVYFRAGKRNVLASKVLLTMSILFFIWSIADFSIWFSADSRMTMFVWSFVNVLEMLVSAFTLYFAYVFLEKRDAPFKYKLFASTLILIYTAVISTTFNLTGFDVENCEAQQGVMINYFRYTEVFFLFWITAYLLRRIIVSSKSERRMVVVFSLGVLCFIASFSGANVVASYTENWNILQYGLFGMPVFMAFLGYLIVRYRAFDIRLFGVQALVTALTLLIGSQFFFITTFINRVLTGVTFILVLVAGMLLIHSFKREHERKEQLQLMTDKLTVANHELRKLDMAKTEFISIASHQLRTPLTAIKGYASLLIEGSYGKIDSALEDVIHKIYTANDHLIQLVENLLNISRMESGRMEYTFESVRVDDMFREIRDSFSLMAENKKIDFSLDFPVSPLPLIYADAQKIHEVFSNLVDNAFKYTQEGSVSISVSQKDKDTLRVVVKDSGIGIPKEELPHLFVKFSRGKNTSRLHANGTGLGLYVVKSIVEAHKGKVWIESEGEGHGTSFIVELPIKA